MHQDVPVPILTAWLCLAPGSHHFENHLGVQEQEVGTEHSINHSIARIRVSSDFELDHRSSTADCGAFSRSTTVETSPIDFEESPDILQLRETCLKILLQRLFLTQHMLLSHTFVDSKPVRMTVSTCCFLHCDNTLLVGLT